MPRPAKPSRFDDAHLADKDLIIMTHHEDSGVWEVDDVDFERLQTRKKKLLFRLVVALGHAGNYSFYTEAVCQAVASSMGLSMTVMMLPTAAIITFQKDPGRLDPDSVESYCMHCRPGLSLWRMAQLEDLVRDLRKMRLDLGQAEDLLSKIESAPEYHWAILLAAYVASSASATAVLYGGSWRDVPFGAVLGLIVGIIDVFGSNIIGFGAIGNFASAAVVGLLATLVDHNWFASENCLFAQMFGGTIWILPGLTITSAIVDLFSNNLLWGTCTIVMGLLNAMQLSLGMAVGYGIVKGSTSPPSFTGGCASLPNFVPVDPSYSIVLLPICSVALAILCGAHWSQLFGFVLCSVLCFYLSSVLAGKIEEVNFQPGIPFLASLVLGFVGLFLVWLSPTRHQFRVVTMGGVAVMVPGGVGVKGMSAFVRGDASNGMQFTFNMLSIGISIGMGLFMARHVKIRCKRMYRRRKKQGFLRVPNLLAKTPGNWTPSKANETAEHRLSYVSDDELEDDRLFAVYHKPGTPIRTISKLGSVKSKAAVMPIATPVLGKHVAYSASSSLSEISGKLSIQQAHSLQ